MAGNPETRTPDGLRRGVVAVILRGGRFLVIRRSHEVRAPRAICFPGGGIEPGETQSQALRRELREELDCEIIPRRHLCHTVTAWHVALDWWLCDLAANVRPTPNPAEVESIHWLTADEIRNHPDVLSSNLVFLDLLDQDPLMPLPPFSAEPGGD